MRLPVSKLSDHIFNMVSQLKEAKCRLQKECVADIEFNEEMTIEVELVPDGGFNAVQRHSTETKGVAVTTESRPTITETSTELAHQVTSQESAATVVRTEERVGEDTVTSKSENPYTRTTSKTGGGSTGTKNTEHTSGEEERIINSGGVIQNEIFNYGT
jgi:hypothetical protein